MNARFCRTIFSFRPGTLFIRLLLAVTVILPDIADACPGVPVTSGILSKSTVAVNEWFTIDASASYDTDANNGGYTPKLEWDYDYNNTTFIPNATHYLPIDGSIYWASFPTPGTHYIAVRYTDNDNVPGNIKVFSIFVLDPCDCAQSSPSYSVQVQATSTNSAQVTATNNRYPNYTLDYAMWEINELGLQGDFTAAQVSKLNSGTPFSLNLGASVVGAYTFTVKGYNVTGCNQQCTGTFSASLQGIQIINSVKSQTVLYPEQVEANIFSLPVEKKSEAIAYSNVLGKPIQTVAVKASPTKKDVVTHIEYDQYGMQSTSYLPYTSETSIGAYKADAKDKQLKFYQSGHSDHPVDVASTGEPFAKTIVERSPLLRTIEQGAVGAEWQPGQHTVKTAYGTNAGSEVLMFDAGESLGALSVNSAGHYPAGALYKTTVTNEDGKISIVYRDKSDKEIMKESRLGSDKVQTYYVYDKLGNLRFVIPPAAIKEKGTGTWSDALRTKWVTEYAYDGYNRQIRKLPPEEDTVTTVYDILGRVVLRQDGLFRSNKDWLFTKYDKQSRVIMTGVYHDGNSSRDNRDEMQDYVNTLTDVNQLYETRNASSVGYTTSHFPPVSEADIWTITYYDDYDFNNDGNPEPDVAFIADEFPAEGFTLGQYWVTGHTEFYRLKDMVTKTKVRHDINPSIYSGGIYSSCPSTPNTLYFKGTPVILKPGFRTNAGQTVYIGPSISVPADQIRWLETVTFYDKYGRVIQTQSKNHLEGTDVASSQYEFSGKVLGTKLTHMKGSAQKQITVNQRFTYDAAGRSLYTYQQNNSEGEKIISRLVYNEIGQVMQKKLYSADNTNFLQTLDYTYNERGWLREVNNPYTIGDDLFAFKLTYNTTEGLLANTRKWDGTITAMVLADDAPGYLGMGKVGYKYEYDDLGRLKLATYGSYNNPTWYTLGYYTEEIPTADGYDYNGNIKRMLRTNSGGALIDNLTYIYDTARGNRLKKVDDAADATLGFVNGAGAAEEYTYDANGNQTMDLNKGITNISYNLLNLPTSISWSNGNSIKLWYSMSGEKQRMMVTQSGATTTTDYVGGFEYNNATLQHFAMSEGRVNAVSSPMEYEFFLKDHLGNVRMTVKDAPSTAGKIAQQDFYYPFGLREKIWAPGAGNKKLYNGKELVDQNGLNWYHYGARWYDPQIARWTTMDPADEFHSPYVYVGNVPTMLVDPDGRQAGGPAQHFVMGGRNVQTGYLNALDKTLTPMMIAFGAVCFGAAGAGEIALLGSEAIAWVLTNPVTATEITAGALAPPGMMITGMPSNANFAQSAINKLEKFSEEGQAIFTQLVGQKISTVDDLASAIVANKISVADIPVDYVVIESQPIIHNTRTALALERAGIPRSEWNAINQTDNPEVMNRVLHQLENNDLPLTGTPTID